MKRSFILLLLLMVTKAFSQSQLPPIYEIKTDTPLFTPLPGKYVQVLDDKTGKLTFNDLMRAANAKNFHSSASWPLQIADHTYWFVYVLKNGMNRDAQICFPQNSQKSTLYITSDQVHWQKYENGWYIPWSEQIGLKLQQAIPVTLKTGTSITVVNRVSNNYQWRQCAIYFSNLKFFSDGFSNGFASTNTILTEPSKNGSFYIDSVFDATLLGILVLAAILNFFFFLIVRERVYLFFSIYLLLFGIGRVGREFYFTFFRDFREIGIYVTFFAWTFTIPASTLFIRSLLKIRGYLPALDKFLIGLLVCLAIAGVVGLYPNPYSYTAVPILEFLAAMLLIASVVPFFLLSKKKRLDKNIKILVLPAYLLWAIGLAIVEMNYSEVLPDNGFILWLSNIWPVVEAICLSWLVVCYSWILFERFRTLQKQIIQQALDKEREKNLLIAAQKVELERTVEERTAELKNSLVELKSTQSQLIQSEKMASLGELTAGIAHEIQNPLNFVNNFSELNTELVGEIKQEIENGDLAEIKAIAVDIEENSKKINMHGKRAEAIVKGMLQHSQSGSGVKEPTNINALADECMRLAYHGFRAKDKSFNAEMVTHLDETLPKVNLIPQDMVRVMLNLFNNAFYAVSEKAKTAGADYKPEVSVSTSVENSQVVIKVKDNGVGIPDAIKEKIMQPFFTTKPTGEGTGLGLSLTYDMVVKGHGGKIDINTKEGEFTEFIVSLPL
jgi:two-component system NtrC family sensor kinase